MMEPMQESNAGTLNIPPKRKPPKLKRKVSSEIERDQTNNQLDNDTTANQVPRATEEDTMSIDRHSVMDNEYRSDPETLTASEDAEEAHPLPATQTTVVDRPNPAPVNTWQRRKRGKRGDQQLLPVGDVGDVGKTVNETVDLVQDVGSKAINSVGNTAGKALGDAVGGSRSVQKEKDEQLRLRLDLNLDIEVQLKAKIHGDLTLQLLN